MNLKIMQLWLERWLPKTLECVHAFKDVFELPEIKAARVAMGAAPLTNGLQPSWRIGRRNILIQ